MRQNGDYNTGQESRWQEGIDLVLDKYAFNKPLRVLDVGCGDGSFLRFLRREAKKRNIILKGLEYYGIDVAREYRDLARKEGVEFQVGNALNLQKHYNKEFFDVIIASEILEHVSATDKLIKSIRNVLKKDGYLYLTTPNLASWHSRLVLLLGYQPLITEVSNEKADFGKGWIWKFYGGRKTQPIHHIRCFTLRALKEFLNYHGFEVEHINGGGYRTVENFVFRIFVGLSPVIKIICRKIKGPKFL